MAYGVEQQIGIGQAQVLSPGPSHMPIAEQFHRQRRYKDERDRYAQHQKKQDEKDLYDLIGDNLKLRDFNPVIHDRVRKAQVELTNTILKNPGIGRGDLTLAAQNAAGKLGLISGKLNQLDQIIAGTKKEFEGDKRLNIANIEAIARKNVKDQLEATGDVDVSVNPFDKALNNNYNQALTDNADYTVVDFKNARKQPLEGRYSFTNRNRGMDKFFYKTEHYPDLYDFEDGGEGKEPVMTTKSVPSGIKESGMDKMLSDEAYGFFKTIPSNVVALNKRLGNRYGKDFDPNSEEAETLRKIEAYKEVENKKPKINKFEDIKADPKMSYAFNFGSGFGQPPTGQTRGNVIDGIVKNIKHLQVKDGVLYNQDGSAQYEGNWKIKSSDVPADLFSILNTGGYDLDGVKEFDAEIEKGIIVGLTPMQGVLKNKKINRKAIERAQHKYYNPGKNEPYVDFDKPDEPSGGGTIKGSEVPKGAKVIQKDGAYYYNGKKII